MGALLLGKVMLVMAVLLAVGGGVSFGAPLYLLWSGGRLRELFYTRLDGEKPGSAVVRRDDVCDGCSVK
jgi:hypothetical protein